MRFALNRFEYQPGQFMFTRLLLPLAFALLHCSLHAQSYSDPYAPVGDPAYTVPASVRPILNVWMRDTYVTYGPDGKYYLTGTTVTPGRVFDSGRVQSWDYNDGIYLWSSPDMLHWDSLGRVWSFYTDATWQAKGTPIPPGRTSVNGDKLDSFYRAVWAPELHYIKSKKQWLMAGCLSGKRGSFILRSTSGKPTGPWVNIAGNESGPIYDQIDVSIFEDDNGAVYLIGKDHYVARMKDDLSGLAEPFQLLKETPYNPEPYIEGVYMTKHHGKYQLMQTVWSIRQPDNSFSYIEYGKKGQGFHSYDVVVAEADNIYGPYGSRYPAVLQGGHNAVFQDAKGEWWSTAFFNPRGEMGQVFPVTCRPALVAVKWVNGKMQPDIKRTNAYYERLAAIKR